MMDNTLDKTLRRLRIAYFLVWILSALVALLYETGVLEEGTMAHDGRDIYILQSASVLLTLFLIPFSLKMFSVVVSRRITQLADEQKVLSYIRWSEVRLALLAVVVFVGLSVYYSTLSNVGGFCALLGLLALFFCWPGKERVKEELGL